MSKQPRPHTGLAYKITRVVGSPASIVIHTLIFAACFAVAGFRWIPFDEMLLVLTTALSLEAIYLALFIQMTVNVANESLQEVEQDIDAIQEDVDEIQEDIDEIQEDVDEIQEDVDEIQEDVEEIQESDAEPEQIHTAHEKALEDIRRDLQKLLTDVERLRANP